MDVHADARGVPRQATQEADLAARYAEAVAKHLTVPLEARKRAPQLSREAAVELKRQMQAAATSPLEDAWKECMEWLLSDFSGSHWLWERLASRAGAAATQEFRAQVLYWQQNWRQQGLGGLPGGVAPAALKKRVREMGCQINKLVAAAGGVPAPTRAVTTEEQATAAATSRKPRGAAMGQQRRIHDNVPGTGTALVIAPRAMRRWTPEVRDIELWPAQFVGMRTTPYRPTERQQMEQWQKVKGWKMHRVLHLGYCNACFFHVEEVQTAVESWRAGVAGTGARKSPGLPPTEILELAIQRGYSKPLYTMTSNSTGMPWSEEGPFDVGQCARMFQSGFVAKDLRQMVNEGTISEHAMRQLFGQATHHGTILACIRRMEHRTNMGALHRWQARTAWRGGRRRRVGWGIICIGAGIGLTGLQVQRATGGQIAVCCESCPKVRKALERLMELQGERPVIYGEAESREAEAERGGLIDVVSLRCSPFSEAGASLEQEAAVTEHKRVLEACAARRSAYILWETAVGIECPKNHEVRLRVEALMMEMGGYEWEKVTMSPDKHLGVGVVRERVIWMAVRKDLLAEGEMDTASRARWAAVGGAMSTAMEDARETLAEGQAGAASELEAERERGRKREGRGRGEKGRF